MATPGAQRWFAPLAELMAQQARCRDDLLSDNCFVIDICIISPDQIQAFVLLSRLDSVLMERLKAAADIDSDVEIATEAGFAVTREDLELRKANSQN